MIRYLINTYHNFYPRSPCGERRITIITICTAWRFLSTLSLRRATPQGAEMRQPRDYFYPRSPCGERRCTALLFAAHPYFYPRSPCGERQSGSTVSDTLKKFLSTLSLRRATQTSQSRWLHPRISIHALLAESDAVGTAQA